MSEEKDKVTLIVDGISFHYNKELLINASQYFSAMFSDHFAEKDKLVIHIQDVNPTCFQIILDHMIEDQEIIWENCDPLELLRTASMLQFDQVQNKCMEYISETWLKIETCLPTMFLCDQLGIRKLYKRASILAQWEFEKVIHTNAFQSLTFDQLYGYLNMKDLNIVNEFSMFEAIRLWIESDLNARESHINVLLEFINYAQLTILEINDMLFYACITGSEYAKSLLNCIKNIKIDKNYVGSDEILFVTARELVDKCKRSRPIQCFIFACVSKTHPRSPYDFYENMKEKTDSSQKIGCKNSSSYQPVILYHDCREDTLKISLTLEKMCEIQNSVVGHQVVPIGQEIWILGGEYQIGRGEWNMSVWKFNTWMKKWEHETCLPKPRRHHTVVCLEDEIFLIGGVGRYRVMLETVDRYNIKSKLWEKCSNLPSCGYLIACCEHMGSIYVFDGTRVLQMKPPLYTWKVVGTIRISLKVDIAMSYRNEIYFTDSSKSNLYKLNVHEESLPLEDLGHFKVQSESKTCLIEHIIYHWSEDEDIITLETYDIEQREFTLRWSKHRDDFDVPIYLNQTSGCFTMLNYE